MLRNTNKQKKRDVKKVWKGKILTMKSLHYENMIFLSYTQ